MPLIDYVNSEYRTKKVSEILTKGNTDGKLGLSRQEVKTLIQDGHNKNSFIFGVAKFLLGVDRMTNSVFKAIDKYDLVGENKPDNIITLEECDLYAQKECGYSLKDIWDLTVEEVCEILDNTSKKKKNKKEPNKGSSNVIDIKS